MESTHHHGKHSVGTRGIFRMHCYGPDGELKWTEDIHNLVTDTGRENYLKAVLKGDNTAQNSTWYVGLIQGTTANITLSTTDTASSTNLGWTESTDYSEASRPSWDSGAVGSTAVASVSNSTSVASFSINSGTTIGGAFLPSSNTKGDAGTTSASWTLHSEGTFSTGARNPSSGDTLEVTVIQDVTT